MQRATTVGVLVVLQTHAAVTDASKHTIAHTHLGCPARVFVRAWHVLPVAVRPVHDCSTWDVQLGLHRCQEQQEVHDGGKEVSLVCRLARMHRSHVLLVHHLEVHDLGIVVVFAIFAG